MDLLTVIKCKTSCKLLTLRRRGVVGLLTSGQTDYTRDSRITTVHHAHDPSTPLCYAPAVCFCELGHRVINLTIAEPCDSGARTTGGGDAIRPSESCGRTDVSLVAAADLSVAFAAPVMWDVFAVMSGSAVTLTFDNKASDCHSP